MIFCGVLLVLLFSENVFAMQHQKLNITQFHEQIKNVPVEIQQLIFQKYLKAEGYNDTDDFYISLPQDKKITIHHTRNDNPQHAWYRLHTEEHVRLPKEEPTNFFGKIKQEFLKVRNDVVNVLGAETMYLTSNTFTEKKPLLWEASCIHSSLTKKDKLPLKFVSKEFILFEIVGFFPEMTVSARVIPIDGKGNCIEVPINTERYESIEAIHPTKKIVISQITNSGTYFSYSPDLEETVFGQNNEWKKIRFGSTLGLKSSQDNQKITVQECKIAGCLGDYVILYSNKVDALLLYNIEKDSFSSAPLTDLDSNIAELVTEDWNFTRGLYSSIDQRCGFDEFEKTIPTTYQPKGSQPDSWLCSIDDIKLVPEINSLLIAASNKFECDGSKVTGRYIYYFFCNLATNKIGYLGVDTRLLNSSDFTYLDIAYEKFSTQKPFQTIIEYQKKMQTYFEKEPNAEFAIRLALLFLNDPSENRLSGIMALSYLKDPDKIKKKYHFIFMTTTPESGNLFKRVHEELIKR